MNLRPFIPLILATLVLVGSAGLYGFGFYLLVKWNTEAATLATEIDTKTQMLEQVSKAHEALASLASDQASLNQYSVDRADIAPFLESLQATGRSLGTKVDVLSVADEKSGGHNRIGLSLSVSGSFDSVMRTLGAIEYGPYDGVISRLSLNPTSDQATSTRSGWLASATYSVGVNAASSTKP